MLIFVSRYAIIYITMENINVSTRVDFKDLIDITDSKKYADFAEELAGKSAQRMEFPISSDMPEEMPFAIFQVEDTHVQVMVSKRSITIQQSLKEFSTDNIAKVLSEQLRKTIDDKIVRKSDIRAIACSTNTVKTLASFDQVIDYMKNTEYKDIASNINRLGFSLTHFSDSNIEGADGQSTSYTAYADQKTKKIGLNVGFFIMSGGMDFNSSDFIEQTTDKVSNFLSNLDEVTMKKLLEEIYDEQLTGTK